MILVTGANRGQGKMIAKHLASEGATIIVAARHFSDAQTVVEEIGEQATACQLDVTQADEWDAAMSIIMQNFNKLDVLVNNAGVFLKKPFIETTAEEYLNLIEVNQLSVFLGMQAAARQMIPLKQGSIINNVSISSFSPITHSSVYASTKAAVATLSKATAVELGRDGIRVNMVHPGLIETEMAQGLYDQESLAEHIPLARPGYPSDVAKAIAFLASDDSSYCTGTEIVVDGGVTIGNRL
ncbi:3-oxoacyl-[acyl-carrier protein] reductase [Bacillus sp. JCM 19045]|nr:3-oxoacyl-[acyl-carrier protein] reductase [Bacillus sp. JCM 19045]